MTPPSPSEAGSSEASPSSAAASSSNAPYVENAGPGFDEKQAPPELPSEEPSKLAENWTEEQVAEWLHQGGRVIHAGVGKAEHDWQFLKSDLDAIAPPLARIMNRYEPARRLAEHSDPLAVGLGLGMYGWRSVLEMRQAQLAAGSGPDQGAELPSSAPSMSPSSPSTSPSSAPSMSPSSPASSPSSPSSPELNGAGTPDTLGEPTAAQRMAAGSWLLGDDDAI